MAATQRAAFSAWIIGLWALLALATAPIAAADPGLAAQGCHREWPVVAHRAGGAPVVLPPSAVLPIACAVETGTPTSDTTIAVGASGLVVFSPAQSENTVGRSLDGGATWQLSGPAVEQNSRV